MIERVLLDRNSQDFRRALARIESAAKSFPQAFGAVDGWDWGARGEGKRATP